MVARKESWLTLTCFWQVLHRLRCGVVALYLLHQLSLETKVYGSDGVGETRVMGSGSVHLSPEHPQRPSHLDTGPVLCRYCAHDSRLCLLVFHTGMDGAAQSGAHFSYSPLPSINHTTHINSKIIGRLAIQPTKLND